MKEIWRTDEKFLSLLGDGIKATEHDKLFNEIFSAYYHIFAAIFCEICSHSGGYTEKNLNHCVRQLCINTRMSVVQKCWEYLSGRERLFVELLKDGGFMLKKP